MRSNRAFAGVLVALTAGTLAVAGTSSRPLVTDHIPQIDGPVVAGVDATGRTWATWSYRASGEFDLAVVTKPAGGSIWSAPAFIGRRDGIDQVDPALAFDAAGTTYLAFGTRNPTRIGLAVLRAGASSWSDPIIVPNSEGGSSPALHVVGDRLVIAFRTPQGVVVVDLPSVGQPRGIQDGPDGVDPLGAEGGTPMPGEERNEPE
ncbi:MAG TPA: hypothetical protein VFB67_00375 [Candidatus Polarisedimenticolaceae bacterium]|nr:hypothetical protein [Candidatus Polarisedimenticolaceae bacterium]